MHKFNLLIAVESFLNQSKYIIVLASAYMWYCMLFDFIIAPICSIYIQICKRPSTQINLFASDKIPCMWTHGVCSEKYDSIEFRALSPN